MADIKVGEVIPDGLLAYLDEQDHLQKISMFSLAAGRTVILFGVPGAFTPSCRLKHVNEFIARAEELKSKGVDEILCISVNDPFVMKLWAQTYFDNKHVRFLADGSGTYTRAPDLELDRSDEGLGIRSQSFALLVENLEVKVAEFESGGEFTLDQVTEIVKEVGVHKPVGSCSCKVIKCYPPVSGMPPTPKKRCLGEEPLDLISVYGKDPRSPLVPSSEEAVSWDIYYFRLPLHFVNALIGQRGFTIDCIRRSGAEVTIEEHPDEKISIRISGKTFHVSVACHLIQELVAKPQGFDLHSYARIGGRALTRPHGFF